MTTRRTGKGICHEGWCPIERTLGVIGGVWKVLILRELLSGARRYGSLHRTIGGVTHKMLTQQLRELERDGVVHRKVYQQIPPKVEYSLTGLGIELAPILKAMHSWGSAREPGAAAFPELAAAVANPSARRSRVAAGATR
ncbi:MAG TPA: helix-turn-helix domain-containing protein [Gemmatimonadales bacterium]|nr:helix-turn-helix domain-containing protein [Gemmatimonadales bacterium]